MAQKPKKLSSKRVAAMASRIMDDKRFNKDSKAVAASALSQAKDPSKTTSRYAAAACRRVWDKSTSKVARSVAGSVLAQVEK